MLIPEVREMIVCEDARVRKGSRGKIDIFGLMNKATVDLVPANLSFSVFLCLTAGRGSGEVRIDVVEADSGTTIYSGDLHHFDFDPNPLTLHPFLIRVPLCHLPRTGLYWVEFVYNDDALERRPLLVEKSK